ncbi:hypothetical protein ACWC10_38345, partial [Streptomyces sp. NPDC001595]
LRWPARIDGRQVSHEPVYSPDWTATLLELGGAVTHVSSRPHGYGSGSGSGRGRHNARQRCAPVAPRPGEPTSSG